MNKFKITFLICICFIGIVFNCATNADAQKSYCQSTQLSDQESSSSHLQHNVILKKVKEFAIKSIPLTGLSKKQLGQFFKRIKTEQKRLAVTNVFKYYISYVLAWYNIDYIANVEQIEQPIQDCSQNPLRLATIYGDKVADEIGLEGFLGLLQRLYIHKHDVKILKRLLMWRLDGAPADMLDDIRFNLTVKDTNNVLKMARNSQKISRNLVASLSSAEEKQWLLSKVIMTKYSMHKSKIFTSFISSLITVVEMKRRRMHQSQF